MLSIEEIKKQYPDSLHKFERGLFREYLQYLILSIIFKHSTSHKLSFLGGTSLRIVYGIKRFSEDIDFDNKGLSFEEFEELSDFIKSSLEKYGYEVEIRIFGKGAFHCYLKIPKLLYEQGISPVRNEKILIQLDTFDQGVNYESELFILDKFSFLSQVLVTPKEVILSQKLWTITQRKRPKGRDFYDIMILLQDTKPNLSFLESKFGTANLSEILDKILSITEKFDFEYISKDIMPFLFDSEDAMKIKQFNQFLSQKMHSI